MSLSAGATATTNFRSFTALPIELMGVNCPLFITDLPQLLVIVSDSSLYACMGSVELIDGVDLQIKRLKASTRLGAPEYFLFALLGAYLIFAVNLPVSLLFQNIHDDALFWEQALSITQGQWLGEYSNRTLLKGPGFSIFLAGLKTISLNAIAGLALLHSLAIFLFYVATRSLRVPKWTSVFISSVMLFSPMLFVQRLIRDYFYASIFLIALSLLAIALSSRLSRIRSSFLFSLSGLSFGLTSITREESVWLLPFFVLLIVALVVHLRLRLFNISTLLYVGAFTMGFVAPSAIVSVQNAISYSTTTVVERNSTEFSDALETLYSVSPNNRKDYVPVPLATRQELYKASPSFSELRSYLDGDGLFWTQFGCMFYKSSCGDYAAGWFEFALRDAMADKGYYSSATASRKFLVQLTNEIKNACGTGSLVCGNKGLSLIPSLTTGQLKKIPESFLTGVKKVSYLAGGPDSVGADVPGGVIEAETLRQVLGNPISKSPSQLSGWYLSQDDEEWLELNCGNGKVIEVSRLLSQDVASAFGSKFSNSRFAFDASGLGTCSLILNSGTNSLSLLEIKDPGLYEIEESRLNIDTVPTFMAAPTKIALGVSSFVTLIYSVVFPMMFFIGITIFFTRILLVKSRKDSGGVLLLMGGALVLLISRLLLLATMDVSIFSCNARRVPPACIR